MRVESFRDGGGTMVPSGSGPETRPLSAGPAHAAAPFGTGHFSPNGRWYHGPMLVTGASLGLPFVPLGRQDRFDTHFAESSAWHGARAS
jgi:hypothetical protein